MATAKLDKWSEDHIALGLIGGEFISHAASKLICHNGISSETHYYLLCSAFRRHDGEAVRRFITDWVARLKIPSFDVWKWVPGDHYHTLGEKFNTIEEAKEFLRSRGYRMGEYRERFVYNKQGD